MDWEIYHVIEQAELSIDEDQDEAILTCQVPTAAEHFHKLLDGATQASMDFSEGEIDGQAAIGFRLRNANGEFYLALLQKDWELLLDQPDEIVFIYEEGEKGRFQTQFLNWMLERFIDEAIDRYNEGNKSLFTNAIVHTFGEED